MLANIIQTKTFGLATATLVGKPGTSITFVSKVAKAWFLVVRFVDCN